MTDLEKKEKRKLTKKIYYEKNKEKIKLYLQKNKEEILKNKKIYREKNKEEILKYAKIYYNKNKEEILKNANSYREKNKEKINKYRENRKKTNPLFKLSCNIRVAIYSIIKKQGYKKESKTFKILGCSYEEFKHYIERQFKKGMTWDNQGEWHLDHIYPVSLAKDEAELIKLNHYTNFQPLWAKDNLSKHNKIIPNTQIKLI
jgi:hypothetical protein